MASVSNYKSDSSIVSIPEGFGFINQLRITLYWDNIASIIKDKSKNLTERDWQKNYYFNLKY